MEERVSEMEHSLLAEIERLQNEVESAKQGAELVCHTADNLRTEVANLESAITEKKRQVERLVADMKEANLQSLAVLPPEDQKMLLEGTTYIFLYSFYLICGQTSTNSTLQQYGYKTSTPTKKCQFKKYDLCSSRKKTMWFKNNPQYPYK